MSRIGNKVINLPAGVTCTVANDNTAVVKGPKGELSFKFNSEIQILVEESTITLTRPNDSVKALHGTARAVLANMVKGVSEGFTKKLVITGVGYRAALQGTKLVVSAGYSHNIEFEVPAGIKVELPKNTEVIITGIDKQAVGQVPAVLRQVRKPETNKGKGIAYSDKTIRHK